MTIELDPDWQERMRILRALQRCAERLADREYEGLLEEILQEFGRETPDDPQR